MHTLKKFIVLPQGQDIVDVTVGEVGKQVTLICFENKILFESQNFRSQKPHKGEAAIITLRRNQKKS